MRTHTEIGETELLTLRRISLFTLINNHGSTRTAWGQHRPVGMKGF